MELPVESVKRTTNYYSKPKATIDQPPFVGVQVHPVDHELIDERCVGAQCQINSGISDLGVEQGFQDLRQAVSRLLEPVVALLGQGCSSDSPPRKSSGPSRSAFQATPRELPAESRLQIVENELTQLCNDHPWVAENHQIIKLGPSEKGGRYLVDGEEVEICTAEQAEMTSAIEGVGPFVVNAEGIAELRLLKFLSDRDSSEIHFSSGGSSPSRGQRSARHLDTSQLTCTEECLGQGGFGAVFKGLYDGQAVAVKRLHVQGSLTDQQRKALHNEIAALTRLSPHPRLVAFIGACVTELLVVTEFMPNGSLHILLHVRNATLEPHRQMQMAQQVAEGVAFLHSEGIIHRDLKSMNILLDTEHNLKICDFGLARTLGLFSSHITVTAAHDCGSPRYLAPELFEASNRVTPKVDIWALGCVLNEIFGGSFPWPECRSIAQIAHTVVVQQRVPDLSQTLTAQQRAGITACWRFEPRDRPMAAEVLACIREMSAKSFPAPPK